MDNFIMYTRIWENTIPIPVLPEKSPAVMTVNIHQEEIITNAVPATVSMKPVQNHVKPMRGLSHPFLGT